MNNLQNRIDSFKNSTVKWPHTEAQFHKVESFAKAGFYFVRRPKAIDSLRCFLCDVEVSHWKLGQSPFSRHSKESPSCALCLLNFPDANNKPLTVNHRDRNSQPRGPTMRAARLTTFNHHNFWPPNKGMLSKTRRYPTATKLADAGFFFSPTNEHTARIKCPYCRIEIEDPDKNVNILDKHQELGSDCPFFVPTHNMRAIKNRRDTVESSKSNDTFKTANSDLEEESTSIEHSMYEPPSTKSKKPRSKPEKTIVESSSENESDFENVNKPIKRRTQPKEKKTPASKKPIKIVKRQKASENLNKTGTNKRKREESDDLEPTTVNDDIWSIEQIFASSTNVRKPAITFGSKKVRQLPSTRRMGSTSIDIFSKLKPVKPASENKNIATTHGVESTSQSSRKRSLIETPKIIDPVADKNASKSPTKSRSITTRKTILKTPNEKSSITTPTASSSIPRVTDSSFSSSSSNLLKASSSSSTSKPLKFSSPSSSTLPPSNQKTDTIDIFPSEENIESAIPSRDKGKGRAVEFNITPTSSTVKKSISLSLSKSKSQKSKEIAFSTPSSSQSFLSNGTPSATKKASVTPITLSEPITDHVHFSLESSSSNTSNIPTFKEPVEAGSPVAPLDTTMSDIYDPTLPEGFLDNLPDTNTIMETTPPAEFMDRTPSPQLTAGAPSPQLVPRSPSPVNRIQSPQLNKRTPSPQLKPKYHLHRTPPPPSPSTRARHMTFMQSTPNQESHTVTAFDIFGDCPLSPIHPTLRSGQAYQNTPVMHLSGRTRQVITEDINGTPQRITRPEEPLPPPLDINTIFNTTSISEQHKKMKVKDYMQHIIDENIEKVREHGLKEIKEIQAISEKIKSSLISQIKE